MRTHRLALLSLLVLFVLVAAVPDTSASEQDAPPPETAWPTYEIDAEMARILKAIHAAGPYDPPEIEMRQDALYADTPEALEPFGAVKPFKKHFLEQMIYTGPGRSIPEPEHVDSVKLGFIGPIMSTVSVATGGASHEEPLGIQMLRGTRLAIEEANARGGHLERGVPFELVISNDNGLWGASGNEIVKQAYEDRVWGILGTIDGANSHIAIRVALKAELVMINTGDTDPTFIETNIPWVARVIGDDRQMGYLLVDYVYRKLGYERVGIIRASNRYGRFGVREIRDSSRRLGKPIVLEMAYKLGLADYSLQLERLRAANVQAIVHWGDAQESAQILNQMRASGMKHPFFASDRSVSDEFVESAGANAEGVICGFPWNPHRDDAKLEIFRRNFKKRFGVEPDTYAAHAYDGMNMMIWAVQVAGLNRAKIRDVLAYMNQPWPGVTGQIPLSAALDDRGEVFLARYEGGAWRYLSRKDLEIPGGPIPPRDRSRHADAPPGPDYLARERAGGYEGPGRDEPEPPGLGEVAIGYFGPSDPSDPAGGDLWRAATLAVERANAEGGYRDLPFRLVPAWSEDPWGTGIRDVARMVYTDGVWALVGSLDGASTHLAEQVVAKARLPLISPVSTDQTVNMANVPWIFSGLPGDDALTRPWIERVAGEPFALLSATDHDSHAATMAFEQLLEPHRAGPRLRLEFEPGSPGLSELTDRVLASGANSAVIFAGTADSARLVGLLRNGSRPIRVFGGASMARRSFLERAGAAAEGVVFGSPCDPGALTGDFAREFRDRFGHPPDCAALQAYDAMGLLVAAVRRAGLNRARIGDAMRELAPWHGVAGILDWDALGRNRRPVHLATVRNGRFTGLE